MYGGIWESKSPNESSGLTMEMGLFVECGVKSCTWPGEVLGKVWASPHEDMGKSCASAGQLLGKSAHW